MLNKQNEKLLQELLKKYKQGIISGLYPGNNITFTPTGCRDKIISSTSSGTEGGIQSIQEGDNITIDDTDPLNPIISASSSLFPNGREIVTESRDFRDSDIDKLLIIVGNDITLTMPDSIVFSEQLRTIGLKFLQGYTGCGYQPSHGFTTKVLQLPNDAEFITLITGEYLGKSSVGSIANMQVNSDSGIVTLNKYLYDQSQNAIPLSGEVTGSTSLSAIDKTAITNKTTETIVGTDYVLFGDSSDSNNLKKGLVSDIIAAASGGAVALSAITAATGSNTINNGANTQTWQFNSLTSNTGLVLSSNSTAAASNLQTILSVEQSGANATSTQTTYGAIFSNTKTGTTSTNIAGYFSASGGTTNYSIYADNPSWFANAGHATSNLYLENTNALGVGYASSNHQIYMRDKNAGTYSAYSSVGAGVNGLYLKSTQITATIGATNIIQISGSSSRLLLDDGNGAQLYWNNSGIQCALNVVIFKMNNSEVARFNSSGSLGIGTTTPDASAILDLTSTTKGLAIPTMTATQASAISTPKKSLMIYVTDTNGTFTSAGWWGYNGTIWKLILAE